MVKVNDAKICHVAQLYVAISYINFQKNDMLRIDRDNVSIVKVTSPKSKKVKDA